MEIEDNFSENTANNLSAVFQQTNVPVFQNKVYPSFAMAKEAEKGEVELVQSSISGFVFNNSFQPHIMDYDVHYQNEQANSEVFQKHLTYVLQLLKGYGIKNKKVGDVWKTIQELQRVFVCII